MTKGSEVGEEQRKSVIIESATSIEPSKKQAFLDEVLAVERAAWPSELQASREKMQSRLELFPEGFLVALVDGKIKGVTTSQIIAYSSNSRTWDEITDNGFIKSTHNPSGNALYVVSAGVAPDTQGMGIGSMLIEGQKDVARKHGLSPLVLGARIPGYAKYCDINGEVSAEEYVALKNHYKESVDPEIRFYERRGLKAVKVVPRFEPDEESRDYGVIMVWEVTDA